jgi:adenylate kinase
MTVYIVLLGPPGAGKGTQAKIIAKDLGLAHISSGDIFRENITAKTELGILAQGFMDRGDLVPDDVTIAMIADRLKKPDSVSGAVLDGFPRTPAQADALQKLLSTWSMRIQCVPYINVPSEVLVERLGGRWSCRAQGHVYHEKFNPPVKTGVCDQDGSELYQREDDKPTTVKNRIEVYLKQTTPLLEYYRQQDLLIEIDGTQPIEKVTVDLLAAIKKVKHVLGSTD